MARRRRFRLDRVGLLVLGTLVGFVLSALFVYTWINRARTRVVEERIRIALGLPKEAFELERIEPDGTLRIALRQVAFLDRNRDTIVSAPLARARLVTSTLSGTGAIVFDQGEIVRPYLRLSQDARGEWNALQIFAVEAGGRPVRGVAGAEPQRGRTFDFRGIRLVDGRARITTPTTAPPPGPQPRYVPGRPPERVRYAGRWLSVHTLENLDGDLALVRVKGEGGWRVEIGSLSAAVTNPDTRIDALAGFFDQDAAQNLRFAIRELRTPHSSFDGAGTVSLAGTNPRYDVRLRAHPLDLRDLAGMGFAAPREGLARFGLAIETLAGNRTRWTVTDAQVAVLGSRASGRLTAITAPGQEPVFSDTRLTLEPLRLLDLEKLGFVDHTPFAGEVRGTVTSVDELSGRGGGTLRIDLASSLVPRTSAGAPASSITARGLVRVGGPAGLRFEGVRVDADPLDLATLRAVYPQNAMLRGVVRGGATITGTMRQFRVEGGDLSYVVGGAPETRLHGISATVALDPKLRFSLDARADPLALATLTQLFPSLPFRSATLFGPIHVAGTAEQLAFDVDLNGSAGGVAARGTLGLGGAAPTFDVAGRVTAFRPGALVSGAPDVADSVSGTFSARGSTEDFRFAVNLSQAAGRFDLAGNIRRPGGGPMQFDVAGRVDSFQLGVLLGKPTLLPGAVSGPIRLSGGGRQPYRFDVNLRGAQGVFALNGWYQPGTVAAYSIRGEVAGLDLSALPGLAAFPRTRLTGSLVLDGRGTTPETFDGRVFFNAAPGSTVGSIALTAGTINLTAAGGVLRVDSLLFAGRGFRAQARGTLGLTRNAGPLAFSLNAPNLALLRPLLPGADTLPEMAGAVAMNGSVSGTVSHPSIGAAGQARGFRYGSYAAGNLTFTFAGASGPRGWTGTTRLEGTGLEAGSMQLQALTLEANLTPGRAAFSFSARRDPQTDLTAAGTLELDGLSVRGAVLDDLGLRLAGTDWRLAQRARVAWSADRGLVVENLLLRRTGPGAGGLIAANGVLPPRGNADFRLRMEGIDLAEARRVFPSFPDARGTLSLNAEIHGQVSDPRLTVNARVDSLVYGGVRSDSVQVNASYAPNRMAVNAGVRVAGREVVNAVASIPMRLSLGGIVPGFELLRDQPLTATINADSVPLGLVTQSLPAYLKNGSGTMRARVVVGGTPAHPTVGGDAALENGAFTLVQLGAQWTRVNGRLALHGDTIRVDSLTAHTGRDGRAFVNGTVLLDDGAHPRVDLALYMDDFQVADDPDLAQIQVNARVRLSGRVPAVVVTGTVRIEDGTLYIPSINTPGEVAIANADVGALGGDTLTAPTTGQMILAGLIPQNLQVTVGESVWLQSPDARIQIRGQLVIDRPPGSATNLIFGELDAVRGSYTLVVGPIRRQFDIQQGVVRFFGTPEINPSLDVTAAYQVRGGTAEQPITVLVHLAGTLQEPRVELSTSNRQPLSQTELISLLLLGRTGDQGGANPQELLSGLVLQEAAANYLAAQLENALVSTGAVDYVRVRTRAATGVAATGAGGGAFGLDFLSQLAIEIGKEIVSNVYLNLELAELFGGQPQLGASVEWQISPTLSLRVADEPALRDPLVRGLFRVRRQVTVDARRRWEYGRPREHPHPQPRRANPQQPPPAQPATQPGQTAPPPPTGGGGMERERDGTQGAPDQSEPAPPAATGQPPPGGGGAAEAGSGQQRDVSSAPEQAQPPPGQPPPGETQPPPGGGGSQDQT